MKRRKDLRTSFHMNTLTYQFPPFADCDRELGRNSSFFPDTRSVYEKRKASVRKKSRELTQPKGSGMSDGGRLAKLGVAKPRKDEVRGLCLFVSTKLRGRLAGTKKGSPSVSICQTKQVSPVFLGFLSFSEGTSQFLFFFLKSLVTSCGDFKRTG